MRVFGAAPYRQRTYSSRMLTVSTSSALKMDTPSAPPPSYSSVTQSSEKHRSPSSESVERPLPEGWVRRLDKRTNRTYYIDTNANPPRAIWHHPLDDEEYLDSLVPHNPSERNYAHEYHDPVREASHQSYPEELHSRGLENPTSRGPSQSSGSSWGKRFGHGIEDDFRARWGITPREGGPNDPRVYGYSGDERYLMGRGGRFDRPTYLDSRFGYGYGGRRARRGILTHAINASLNRNDPRS